MLTSTPSLVDVLVIGGGPAGLTSALTAARNVHTAIVFDSCSYRNDRSENLHMLLTWDGKSPSAFRNAARQNTIENYPTIYYEDVNIEKATKLEDIFELEDEKGRIWKGKSLILATGIIDMPLDVPAYDECWGRSIFHCLFCHGFEQQGSPSSGVLAIEDGAPVPMALHFSRNAAQLTQSVTIYTNGNAAHATDIQSAIGPIAPVMVDSRRITKFALGPHRTGLTIFFEDGSSTYQAFLGYKPKSKLKSDFLAEQLGLEVTPQGDLKVSPPFGETSLRGCFAAGDNCSLMKTSPNAVNTGANSAAGATSYVQSRKYEQEDLNEFMQRLREQKPT